MDEGFDVDEPQDHRAGHPDGDSVDQGRKAVLGHATVDEQPEPKGRQRVRGQVGDMDRASPSWLQRIQLAAE